MIREPEDCKLLQDDLSRFEIFCKNNNLFLNSEKCYAITFTRKPQPIDYNYNINGTVLTRVMQIRDLGVVLDSKLTFVPHIDKILGKSFKQLGFVLRVGRPFKSPITYKILYNSYVRSHLEFASAVWQPFYKIHINRIERLQRKFIKSLDFRTGRCYEHYESSAKHHNITLLKHRRDLCDAVMLYKIINNIVDAPDLLQGISFRVPRKYERLCRKKNLFSIQKAKTCYGNNSFLRRACGLYDDVVKDVDLFSTSLAVFKKNSLKCISSLPLGSVES